MDTFMDHGKVDAMRGNFMKCCGNFMLVEYGRVTKSLTGTVSQLTIALITSTLLVKIMHQQKQLRCFYQILNHFITKF